MSARRVALVTGGSRGIGAAIARRLAADGLDVALTYTASPERAHRVVAEIEAMDRRGLAIRADSAGSTDVVDAVERTVRDLGRIDVLVNNAGVFPYGPVEEVTPEQIDRTLAIHARAAFLASQAALRHMGEGGRIVSIGSCLAERVPHAGLTLYAMSKSALIGFTRGLARDVGPRGITVNLVQPGSTDTDMNPADGPGAGEQSALSALGHFARPEDVAAMVGFLASPQGRFVTGAQLLVDGGANA